MIKRRSLLLQSLPWLTSTAACAYIAPLKAQEAYPTRPITLIVPWPAGGSTDISMRILADEASKKLGQAIVVENRPGASGSMAMPMLHSARADGYLIAQMPQTVFRVAHTQKVIWDPIKDITPIIQISGYTFGIVVPVNSEFKTVQQVLQWARANPGKLTVGSNGIGTTPHVVMEDLMSRQKTPYIHVPYKGTAEQMLAVASGQLMVGVNSTGFTPYVEAGKLRLLATFGERRMRRFPQAPTLQELGYGIVAMSPYGIVAPKGLPERIARILHEAFKAAMHEEAHLKEIAKYDQDLAYLGFADYYRSLIETNEQERLQVDRLGLAKAP